MPTDSLWERAEIGARVGAWEWNPASDRWTFSAGWRRLHGVELDCPLDQQDLWALTHPDDAPAARQVIFDALTRLQPCDLEHRIIRRNDGAVRWLHAWGEFVYDEQHQSIQMVGLVHDVTDVASSSSTGSQRDQLQMLLDHTADTIWAVDREYRFTVSNHATQQAVRTILGREFTRGDYVLDLVPPSVGVERWRASYDRAFQGEQVTLEIVVGEPPRWVEYRMTPIRGDDRAIVGAVVVGRNISDRKRLETESQVHRAQLAAVLESAADFVWAVDASYRYMFGNQALQAEMIRVYGRAFAPGESVLDAPVADRVREQWRQSYDRALRGEAFTTEALVQANAHWYEYEYRPIIDAHGSIVGVVVAGSDITTRKQTEAALHESEERYRALADSLPLAMLVEDLDTQTITYANLQACRRFARPSAELIGAPSASLYAEPGERERLLYSLSEQGRADSLVVQVWSGAGTAIWSQVNARLLTYAGRPALQIVFQ